MKKIFILILSILPVLCFAQRGEIDATADLDTTIWFDANRVTYVEIDIGGVEDTDSLWVGHANDASGFVAATGFPIVCDKTTYKQYVNGTWVYRVGVITEGGKFPGLKVAIRYKAVDGDTGDKLRYTFSR